MADENWQQVRKIFDDALRRQPEERQKYVIEICGDDKILFSEVESLLASLNSAESFLETPAVTKVASVIEAETKKIKQGKCFGHYEIVEQIGAGGMGEVYLAKDKKLDRKVAVKILNEQFSGQESNLNRFVSEAKAASALNHPNILTIYEFGEAEDAHFIVSEYVEGVTLREIIRKSGLSLTEILDISIQIAGALSAAHKARLVHRDIKPENIMIRPDGYIKILDFGLAKLIQPKEAIIGLETAKQNDTAKGVILGTVNYMSPEQAKGEKVDERTDIFSFGAVIYEMMAGKTPFAGDSVSETLANLLKVEPPPIARSTSDVPAEFQRIVLKMLRKDKNKRVQTMKALAADLKALRENLSAEGKFERSASPANENATAVLQGTTGDANLQTAETQNDITQKIKKHKLFSAFALIALLVGAFGLGYYFFNRNKTPLVFQAGQITRLTSSGKVKNAAVSPDGKFVAHVQQTGKNQSLQLRQIAVEGETQIIAPANVEIRAVNFSPDGNLIYYIVGKTNFYGTLFQTSTLGAQPKKILDNIYLGNLGVNGIGFSPGGKQIAFVKLSPPPNETSFLMIADADGANERTLISYNRPDLLVGTPAWSPDGATIVCPFQSTNGVNAMAFNVAQPDSAVRILPTDLNGISQIVWLPDGQNLLMIAEDDTETVLNQIYQVAFANGKRRRVNQDFNNYKSVSLTADGRNLVAVRTEQTAHLWTMPANDASQIKQLTDGFEKYDGINGLGWLTSGKIFYESMPGGKHVILQIEPTGGGEKQMMAGGGYGAVSKDGQLLAYQKSGIKNNKLVQGLYLFDTFDGSERELTTGWDLWAEFTPDGKSINFIRWGEGEAIATLRSVPTEGGEPIHLTKFLAITAAISPDGKSIAVARWDGAKTQIVIIPSGGGEPIKTFDVDFTIQDRFGRRSIQWSADGRGINFIRDDKNVSNIWRQSIDGGEPLVMTTFTADLIFNFAFSPDGSQIALSRGKVNSDIILMSNPE